MKILLTNDDGIDAPGLRSLCQALIQLNNEVLIVAPEENMSGTSRSRVSKPMTPYKLKKVDHFNAKVKAYTLNGPPAACVIVALTYFNTFSTDYCISGINAGENLGAGLTISGTFGAAMEAAAYGIPSIAISRGYGVTEDPISWDWSRTEFILNNVMKYAFSSFQKKWSSILNINLPDQANLYTPIVWGKVSKETYFKEAFNKRLGQISYEILYNKNNLLEDDDIFIFAEEKKISYTPINFF
jgi:5'/3'-nucleotidase SurE